MLVLSLLGNGVEKTGGSKKIALHSIINQEARERREKRRKEKAAVRDYIRWYYYGCCAACW